MKTKFPNFHNQAFTIASSLIISLFKVTLNQGCNSNALIVHQSVNFRKKWDHLPKVFPLQLVKPLYLRMGKMISDHSIIPDSLSFFSRNSYSTRIIHQIPTKISSAHLKVIPQNHAM